MQQLNDMDKSSLRWFLFKLVQDNLLVKNWTWQWYLCLRRVCAHSGRDNCHHGDSLKSYFHINQFYCCSW